ncbi:hypothetical protein HWV00_21250 (plasmid) [Moritella sp. 24]|uniref:hypothetical protein n=1 Tax=Moritella sp. 24 TaxID=2746230 RepID=UPI001BA4A0C5|nr:hypothetical protein [Moritella sp. 24]QUM78802.1 hypothetical protein HWV00_21250 [Moritella sp. 24]
MTLKDIKQLFDQVITESPWWAKFKGSEFVTYLVTFVAQVYFRANQVSARRLQESFLSLALKMSSILAHAESKGYVARKRIPTKITIFITNKSNITKYSPKNSVLFSSDNNLYYLLQDALTIEPGKTIEVHCIQGELKYFQSSVEVAKKYLTKQLDRQTSESIAQLSVYMDTPDGKRKKWEPTFLFRNTTADSLAYVEFYSATQQVGIRFGNGVSGLIPELGSLITLECVLTEGFSEIIAGQKLSFANDDDLEESLEILTGDTLVVGSGREDIETVRNNALYHTNYDNSVVFDGDYSFFTRQNIDGLTWFRVWGEKIQEKLQGRSDLDFIGKVYLSAFHPSISQADIATSISALYENVKSLNIEYVPVACKVQSFTIQVEAKILSSNKPSLVRGVLVQALNEAFSNASAKHDGLISTNQIWKELESVGLLTTFTISTSIDLEVAPEFDTFRYLDVESSTINIMY